MKSIIVTTRSIGAVLILAIFAILLSGALAQAQDLPTLEITHIVDLEGHPSVIIVEWTQPKSVAGVEIFVNGPGRWRPKNHGGWIAAENPTHVRDRKYQYTFLSTMPGMSYSFRIRAVDKDGNKGKASRTYKHRKTPCSVYKSYWEGGEPWQNHPYPMPDKWKVKNTRHCKGVAIPGYPPPGG